MRVLVCRQDSEPVTVILTTLFPSPQRSHEVSSLRLTQAGVITQHSVPGSLWGTETPSRLEARSLYFKDLKLDLHSAAGSAVGSLVWQAESPKPTYLHTFRQILSSVLCYNPHHSLLLPIPLHPCFLPVSTGVCGPWISSSAYSGYSLRLVSGISREFHK